MKIFGKLIDIHQRSSYEAEIEVKDGVILNISRTEGESGQFIMPGLIDSHIHIESSMATPGSFSGPAVSRGTIGVVSDPHEIANVLGLDGVKYMIDDAAKVPLKFWFGAPSCVPATDFETNGACINEDDISTLLASEDIRYLAEMMNFPGVLYNDPLVLRKIEIAKKFNKNIDGHAPGLTGEPLRKYINAGITTDHECSTLEEALEKISLGMKILIREGSAARNLSQLKNLIRLHPAKVMLCSDDLHPEMLVNRHIDAIVASLISEGFDLFDVIRSCTVNPVKHYKLNAGLLRPGDAADFIIVRTPESMEVLETWIDGKKVYDRGKLLYSYERSAALNRFNASDIKRKDIEVIAKSGYMRVIDAFDGSLATSELIEETVTGTVVNPDIERDILKIVVKDRYNDSPPAVAFIRGFGLKKGAFAGSVAHDSHNIICVGTNDNDITSAINTVAGMKGGLSVAAGGYVSTLPLPVAGIMSDRPVIEVASSYEHLSGIVKSLGCQVTAPFMTLSFMALLVIPSLKLSDKGLFNGTTFSFVPLFI